MPELNENSISEVKSEVAAQLRQWLVGMQASSTNPRTDFADMIADGDQGAVDQLLAGSAPDATLCKAADFFSLPVPEFLRPVPLPPPPPPIPATPAIDKAKVVKGMEAWITGYTDARANVGLQSEELIGNAIRVLGSQLALSQTVVRAMRQGKGKDQDFKRLADFLDSPKADKVQIVFVKNNSLHSPFVLSTSDIGRIQRMARTAKALKIKIDAALKPNEGGVAAVDSREHYFKLFEGYQVALDNFGQLVPNLCDARTSDMRAFSRTAKIVEDSVIGLLALRSQNDIRSDALRPLYEEVERFYRGLPRVLQTSALQDMAGGVDLGDHDTESRRWAGRRAVIPLAERSDRRRRTMEETQARDYRELEAAAVRRAAEMIRHRQEVVTGKRIETRPEEPATKAPVKLKPVEKKLPEAKSPQLPELVEDEFADAAASRARQVADTLAEEARKRDKKAKKQPQKKELNIKGAIVIPSESTQEEIKPLITQVRTLDTSIGMVKPQNIDDLEALDNLSGALFILERDLPNLKSQFANKEAALYVLSSIIERLEALGHFSEAHHSSRDPVMQATAKVVSEFLAALPPGVRLDALDAAFEAVDKIKVDTVVKK